MNDLKAQLKPRIIQLPSRLCCRGPKNRKIELIIMHATVGGFVSSVDWLRNANRKNKSSAHYVVGKDGGIVQLVKEDDIAWHAGYGRWGGRGAINSRSIGIELVNKNDGRDQYPDSQLEAAIWLCLRSCKQNGIGPDDVRGHNEVDRKRKTDPKGFPWVRFRAGLDSQLQLIEEKKLCGCFLRL